MAAAHIPLEWWGGTLLSKPSFPPRGDSLGFSRASPEACIPEGHLKPLAFCGGTLLCPGSNISRLCSSVIQCHSSAQYTASLPSPGPPPMDPTAATHTFSLSRMSPSRGLDTDHWFRQSSKTMVFMRTDIIWKIQRKVHGSPWLRAPMQPRLSCVHLLTPLLLANNHKGST